MNLTPPELVPYLKKTDHDALRDKAAVELGDRVTHLEFQLAVQTRIVEELSSRLEHLERAKQVDLPW
jgi:predicted RNase H-like nuclease (RuvC/YqgF family)